MDWADIIINKEVPEGLGDGSNTDSKEPMENAQDISLGAEEKLSYIVVITHKRGNPFGGFDYDMVGLVSDSLTSDKVEAEKLAEAYNSEVENSLVVYKVQKLMALAFK